MLKIENTEVMGWEHAIRGMRNPKNSWEKSDSGYCDAIGDKFGDVIKPENYRLGPNDFDLMSRLRNAGTDHRKFMRMITVYLDITAPLYWWKEFDTYKVGTVANSCSTMHKIADKEFTLDDFSYEHLNCEPYHRDWIESATVDEDITSPHKVWMTPLDILRCTIEMLNAYRESYLETKDKQDWWQMIQLLPSSYNQKRTVMLNYEVLANIYKSLRGAAEQKRLGILILCISPATMVLRVALSAAFSAEFMPERLAGMIVADGGMLALGVMFLVLSLVCRYGAEREAMKQE